MFAHPLTTSVKRNSQTDFGSTNTGIRIDGTNPVNLTVDHDRGSRPNTYTLNLDAETLYTGTDNSFASTATMFRTKDFNNFIAVNINNMDQALYTWVEHNKYMICSGYGTQVFT